MSQVNITLNTNTVEVNTTNNQIVVTDPTNPNVVNITQPVTSVVEVISAGPQGSIGPQGPVGPQGPTVNTGSFATTGSNQFNGNQTITGSLSQGSYNIAIGDYSHAEGSSNKAIGNYSHAEGASTKTGVLTAYYVDSIVDGVLLVRGATYGNKSSEFPAGSFIIYDDADFDSTYGRTRFAVLSSIYDGTNTLITLFDNTVQGSGAIIGNPDYITLWTGDQTLRGDYAHAEGSSYTAIGISSHAEGENTVAIGYGSHAEGKGTISLGQNSHAEGVGTRTIGTYTHAEGDNTQTLGDVSHTEGVSTRTGQYGYYSPNISSGIIILPSIYGNVTSQFVAGDYILLDDYLYDDNYSTARFKISSAVYASGVTKIYLVDTTVSTTSAIIGVLGNFQPTNADKVLGGYASHAEGNSTNAIGPYSHAEGDTTQALGPSSHAEGLGTIAAGRTQHVQGQYNIASSAESAFIVGNGTSDAARSNLIFASGSSVQITGSLTVSGSNTFTNIGPAVFSGSINVTNGVTGSLQGTASFASTASFAPNYVLTSATSSMTVVSSSFASTASFAPNYQLTSGTGSMLAPYVLTSTTSSMSVATSSFAQGGNGSFSGSFSGSGANLNSIPASAITGLSSTQIATGSVTASVSTGTGSFQITSGSTSLMFISSSGNAGIGLNNPTYRLHVSSSATGQALRLANLTNYIDFTIDNRSAIGWNGSSGLIYLSGRGNGLFIGDASTDASARLHVKGSGATSATTTFFVQNSTPSTLFSILDNGNVTVSGSNFDLFNNSAAYSGFTLNSNATSTMYVGAQSVYGQVKADVNGSNVWFGATTGGAITRLGYSGSAGGATYVNFSTNGANSGLHITHNGGSDLMTVTSAGKVGIGHPVPTASLHISGATATSLLQIDSPASSSILFVSGSGNVGINTSTPAYPLDVNGTSRFTGNHSIVGSIIQTHPTFTGTHTITFSANNQIRFTNSGIGDYMQAGAGNIVDFLGQRVQSIQRGATFGNSVAATGIVSLTAFAAQSSGIINASGIEFTYPINNTATYTGSVRGIYYNPTLTSLVGTTHRAIETTSGDVLFQSGSTPLLFVSQSGNVGIGIATPSASAQLQIDSTTKGFLPPRMTTAQKNAIATPATGLIVYDTTLLSLFQYTGAAWTAVGGSSLPIKLTSQTILSSSWAATGSYYTSSFTNSNITTTCDISVTPQPDSYLTAYNAQVLPYVKVAAGTGSFYSYFPPSADMVVDVVITQTA